jgi:hypothetical protein
MGPIDVMPCVELVVRVGVAWAGQIVDALNIKPAHTATMKTAEIILDVLR